MQSSLSYADEKPFKMSALSLASPTHSQPVLPNVEAGLHTHLLCHLTPVGDKATLEECLFSAKFIFKVSFFFSFFERITSI